MLLLWSISVTDHKQQAVKQREKVYYEKFLWQTGLLGRRRFECVSWVLYAKLQSQHILVTLVRIFNGATTKPSPDIASWDAATKAKPWH